MQMEAAPPTGTFIGHWLPGLAFVIWGLWWLGHAVHRSGAREREAPLEAGPVAPGVKILALFIAGYIEMPNAGWSLASTVRGFHHITIYMGIALSGVVDLLALRGLLPSRATHFAFAGAAMIGWLIFVGHGNHTGVESAGHALLAWTFFGMALISVVEVAREDWRLDWLRMGGMLTLGTWLIVLAWALFRSGWDLADPARIGLTYLMYVWTALASAILVILVHVFVRITGERSA